MFIDPNEAPVRAAACSERDLLIAASNSWVQSLDNISGISSDLSDSMCRLATGAGFSARKLFTDAEEHIMYVRRPQLVNGIDDQMLNSDLLDRTILITLQAIPKEKRKTETEVWRDFEANAPQVFGALLEVLCRALKDLPTTNPPELPRMADFAKLAVVAESHMGFQRGTFAKALAENKLVSDTLVIENSLVGSAIKKLIGKTGGFEGKASKLLKALEEGDERGDRRHVEWPRLPRQLSVVLRRIAPHLRGVGINGTFPPRSATERRIILQKVRGIEGTAA